MEQWVWPISIALIALVSGFLALTFIPAAVVKKRCIAALAQRSRGRLALTYDDGPGPLLTSPLLNLLAEHGAKATFFLVGFRCERFPDAADAMRAAGHEIGNHTHMHGNAWKWFGLRSWQAARDVHQGYATMSRWIRDDGLFRPPFGKITFWTMHAARRHKAPLCFWTCDGGDTWKSLPDPRVIAQQVADAGGGVVLLHSHDRGADRQKYVLEVTQCLLDVARERGLRLCTMSEILNDATANAAHPVTNASPAANGAA